MDTIIQLVFTIIMIEVQLRWFERRAAALSALATAVAVGVGGVTLMSFAVLTGPVLLVPLGHRLLVGGRGRVLDAGAACAVAAAFLPIGAPAAALAAGWLAATSWNLLVVVRGWWRGSRWNAEAAATVLPFAWLPVAAGWLLASRGGVAPFGFAEPITLLTAAHFHVAGFALAALTLATLRRLPIGRWRVVGWVVLAMVSVAPICIATGFMTTPTLNMIGAWLLAFGVFALATCIVIATRGAEPPNARRMVRFAAFVPVVPLVLAVIYSLGPVLGTPMPSVELMVRAHGIVNAVGFAGLGLAGFTLLAPPPAASTDHEEVLHSVPA
jgi:hypothetical protein